MIYLGLVSALINVIASLALGIAVFSKKPRDAKTRMFTWAMVTVAAWSAMYFCWLLSHDAVRALFYCRMLSAAAILIPICYAHFIIRLTGVSPGKEMAVGYGVAVILSGLSFTPWIVSHVEANRWFPFWPKAGLLYPVYLSFFFYIFVRVTMILLGAFRKATFLRRNQLLYVIIFTLIGLLGASTNYFLWYDIPIPPVGNIFVVVYVIGVAYAVIRFRLMEFNLLIARSVSYMAIIPVLAIVQTVFVVWIYRVAGEPVESRVGIFIGALTGTALLLGWGPRLRRRVEYMLEQRLLGEMSSQRARLRQLAQQISTIKDEEGIFKETVQAVSETLAINHVGLFLRSEFEPNFILRAVISDQASRLRSLQLNDATPLISVLQNSPNSVLLDELEHNVATSDSQAIARLRRESGVELAVPVYAGTFFYGFLALGPRQMDVFFTDTDVSLLEAVGLQVGLSLRARQLERQSNQAEKLIALGTLAAGLAHEIRNPLVSIRTFSELIGEQGGDAEFCREFKNIVGRDVSRIATIVENISAFADNAQVKTEPVDIREVINGVYDIARPEFMQAGVTFDAPRAEIPLVQGNYSQLLQVFLNLFQNAIHALEGRPEPKVTVAYRLVNDDEGGHTLIVSVADNGAGIDDFVRARIFDPFITTKATGDGQKRGMGLGLAIVKRIIEGHRGAITVTSETGRGTTFFVHLPCLP